MSSKIVDFDQSVTLRDFLNSQLNVLKDGTKENVLKCMDYNESNILIYNVQLVWLGNQYCIIGNKDNIFGNLVFIPFEQHIWTTEEQNRQIIINFIDIGEGKQVQGLGQYNVNLEEVPTKIGFNFLGYYDSATEGIQYYDESGIFQINNVTNWQDNINLYARWAEENDS